LYPLLQIVMCNNWIFLQQGVQGSLPLLLFVIVLQEVVSPPVTQKKKGYEGNSVNDEGEEYPVSTELYNGVI